jgi:hypothetical protein
MPSQTGSRRAARLSAEDAETAEGLLAAGAFSRSRSNGAAGRILSFPSDLTWTNSQ